MSDTFNPPIWMRPAMMQTFLASQKFRKKKASRIIELAERVELNCPDGVKLQGSFTKHPEDKGVVVFLHGWEGSENSTYVLSASQFLYQSGYSIFRLNFRDHGDTHHLNEALFHSARLEEIFSAVSQVCAQYDNRPIYLIGFSLGGNFALRILREEKSRSIDNLKHIFAISPVIDPENSAPVIDQSPLIARYFYKKWTTSLNKKQAAFPELYDFTEILKIKSVSAMTDYFVSEYSPYGSSAEYFRAYRVWPDDLKDVKTDTTIIMSVDDPVVVAEDVSQLNLAPCVQRIMLRYGGHNGFFQSLHGPTWYDSYILNKLEAGTE